MKKKIYVIASVAALLMVCVVIVSGLNEAGFINQKENNPFIKNAYENRQPPFENITELSGILENSNDSFYLDDIQLLFGPDDMIKIQASPFDYDSDEIIETINGEIKGLIGSSVIVKGHIIEENQIIVFEINSLPVGRPPHPPSLHDHNEGFMEGNSLRP